MNMKVLIWLNVIVGVVGLGTAILIDWPNFGVWVYGLFGWSAATILQYEKEQ